jgi:anthranilate phosphoribosyltransferase
MPNEIVTRAIDAVASGSDLTSDHAEAVLAEIMEGRTDEVQTAGFLIALRTKGETVTEIAGLARAMRELALPVRSNREDLVDTAGTGGGPTTFNVSTVAALVAAGAGCAVAKAGNRSNTSKCGSADLLEALGVAVDLTPEEVGHQIDEYGFGFMFAPVFHRAMASVVPVRKALAVRTVFNFLGPLTNPASASRQVVGVAERARQETIAEALLQLGTEHSLVVSGDDGMDEISISGQTRVIEVRNGSTSESFLEPADFQVETAELAQVAGGEPEENALLARKILQGEISPARDLTIINAAAAIYVSGQSPGLAEAATLAADSIDSGAALRVLGSLADFQAG